MTNLPQDIVSKWWDWEIISVGYIDSMVVEERFIITVEVFIVSGGVFVGQKKGGSVEWWLVFYFFFD